MKKHKLNLAVVLCLIILISAPLFSYASDHTSVTKLGVVSNIITENYDFGSYNIINGWTRVNDFNATDAYMYCENGDQYNYKPNNILVRKGTNSYSLDEIKTFAQAIEFSLRIQTGQTNKPPKAVTGSGGFTKNYIPLITFNLVWDDGTYQNQYYIVRDYGYVMVSEMVNQPEKGVMADSVAQEILDSFKFN